MVPFLDLLGQYHTIKPEVDQAVLGVLESGQFVLGKAVEEFEICFAKYCGVAHAVACSSGTAALHMALVAAGIGKGDEVITIPMTFIATASAIDYAGATPVFIDIDPTTVTMNPACIEDAITPQTKAIIPVHLYGQMADMGPIREIADRRGLVLIEDAAQSHGAEYRGKRAGAIGEMGCFSFYPGKNLGAYGEGGLITTNSSELADKLRSLRDWGQVGKYNHVLKGFNYRMDGVQGAILGVKMRYVETWTEKRRAIAKLYDELLAGVSGLELPNESEGRRHVWHVYGVRVPAARRREIIDTLQRHSIGTGLHYPVPVHLQPCFRDLGYREGQFPHSERHAASQLSLPMYPELCESHVMDVVRTLRMALLDTAQPAHSAA
jgi:dTDP-4-amino-4,6-dideoxygalactose transaminase